MRTTWQLNILVFRTYSRSGSCPPFPPWLLGEVKKRLVHNFIWCECVYARCVCVYSAITSVIRCAAVAVAVQSTQCWRSLSHISFLCQIAKFSASLFLFLFYFYNVMSRSQYLAHVEDSVAVVVLIVLQNPHRAHNIQHFSCTKLSFSNVESKNGISHNNGIKKTIVAETVYTHTHAHASEFDRLDRPTLAVETDSQTQHISNMHRASRKKNERENKIERIVYFDFHVADRTKAWFVETTWEFVLCSRVSLQSREKQTKKKWGKKN